MSAAEAARLRALNPSDKIKLDRRGASPDLIGGPVTTGEGDSMAGVYGRPAGRRISPNQYSRMPWMDSNSASTSTGLVTKPEAPA